MQYSARIPCMVPFHLLTPGPHARPVLHTPLSLLIFLKNSHLIVSMSFANKIKKKKTTGRVGKTHTFKSFKDRIDGIKIDPNLNLNTRVYDDVEDTSSHFISTFIHWQEINLSGNFSDFVDEVRLVTQSLPQVIYHQDKIFESLYSHIEKNDPHSIQPLLELLSQFIHDLGADFMKFYAKTLDLLTSIAINIKVNDLQNNVASSNLLEWVFNCLSFIFKYLSKQLVTLSNFTITFKCLLPILSVNTRTYLARFCSEALSFLIKKVSKQDLPEILNFLLLDHEELLHSNQTFSDAMIILFSQAIISVNESFHSKGTIVYSNLIQKTIQHNIPAKVLSGVISNLFNHGNSKSIEPFISVTIEQLKSSSQQNQSLDIFTTLIFAESGKKIASWDPLFEYLSHVFENIDSSADSDVLLFCLTIYVRNCEPLVLNKTFKKITSFLIKFNDGKHFIPFVHSGLSIIESKLSIGTTVQEFVNNLDYNEELLQQISLLKLTTHLNVTIPQNMITQLKESINYESPDHDNLVDIYWKLKLIENGPLPLFPLVKLLNIKSLFVADFIGCSIKFIDDEELKSFLESNFEDLRHSAVFLDNYRCDEFDMLVAENLSIGDNALRISSLNFISESKDFIDQIKAIETVPLTLGNARDLQLRIRMMYGSFKKEANKTPLDTKIISHYTFGLLTNKFQPCWQAVFENLPGIVGIIDSEIWSLASKFLSHDYLNQTEHEIQLDEFMDDVPYEPEFNDERLVNAYKNSTYALFHHPLNSIMKSVALTNVNYEFRMRNITLQTLNKVPEVAAINYKEIVQFAIQSEKTNGWNFQDKNLLLELFAKLKHLRKKDQDHSLYNALLLNLTNSNLPVQKLTLEVILNYNIQSINKYSDNLKNLLDNTLFKDELTSLITDSNDSAIEESDWEWLTPIIIRILFGRVQGNTKNNNSKSSILNVLPILSQKQVIEFLKLGADRISWYEGIDVESISIDFKLVKRVNGYVSLMTDLYDVLGYKFKDALSHSIQPLIYGMTVAQIRLDRESVIDVEDVEEDDDDDTNELKSCKKIRQYGMRNLNKLFKVLGDSYNWTNHFESIYKYIIQPRLPLFAQENLQAPSSLLNILTSWIKLPQVVDFLLIDDLAPARAIISLLDNRKAKDSVISKVFDFAVDCFNVREVNNDSFYTLLAVLVDTLMRNLSTIITSTSDAELIGKSVTILLLLIDGEYITEDTARNSLIQSLVFVFDKPPNKIPVDDRERVLISLTVLINECNLEWDEFESHYKSLSKTFRIYKEKKLRVNLVEVFKSVAAKFDDLAVVSEILDGMNSYNINEGGNLGEPNYGSILDTCTMIKTKDLNPSQWLPVIYTCLYFLNDEEELIVRTNANYVLQYFIDHYSQLSTAEEAAPYIQMLKEIVLTDLKQGLKIINESIQTEYINLLAYIIKASKYFEDLNDMKVLLFDNDDEANFFNNVNHIQLHRRQRAVRRLGEMRPDLKASSISHYLLPILENYLFNRNQEESFRVIINECVRTFGLLIRNVNYSQFKSITRKYVTRLKFSKVEDLKLNVNIIVEVSRSFNSCVEKGGEKGLDALKDYPKQQSEIDNFILLELIPNLSRILGARNDDTIVDRIALSEALVYLIKCIEKKKIDENLPGLLTSTCQVLRSRSEELRDASRKCLCHIAQNLGPTYFKFLVQELKTALTRGSQIHVLSFTLHALLVTIQPDLTPGDLDDAISLVVDIIMEDVFGAAGQEKEAEGYHSKMKEVKHKKSFDSGELLASNISLNKFNDILEPIKLILHERISLRIQNKLDELLKRYALGINHNDEASSRKILILSYQINKQSSEIFRQGTQRRDEIKNTSKHNNENVKEHFIVNLNAKSITTSVDFNQYKFVLQKFSFELLRSAISRHSDLLTTSNMEQFIPLLEEGLNSNHEGLISTCLRLLHSIVRLPFELQEARDTMVRCSRKAINLIKDSPTTTSEVCQSSLKFLATLIRHKSDINLKDNAISFVLVKIQPDLEEPKTQGLAFNFLKAVTSKHIYLPELYDIMDTVRKIMVVNHNREIRDMARSVFYQFLMEYEQGKGRLEKNFKFLMDNLSYPTQEGRQSVLELINSIVNKSTETLLDKIGISFFMALSNILINDDSSKCREMSSVIITTIFESTKDLEKYEQIMLSWLKSTHKELLRCALNVYKVYLNNFGLNKNSGLDHEVTNKIELALEKSQNTEEEDEVEWQLVYTALNVFTTLCQKEKTEIFKFESIWKLIVSSLLYPHSWVRLNAAKLMGILLTNLDKVEYISEYEVQTICYRLLRQLAAPKLSEDLGSQVLKNLVLVAMKWENDQTKYIRSEEGSDDEDDDETDKVLFSNEFLVKKVCSIIKQYKNTIESKKIGIKLSAMMVQIIKNDDLLEKSSQDIILSLYPYIEDNSTAHTDLIEVANECLNFIETKLGAAKYSSVYANVKKLVVVRRQERRSKQAQLAVTNPEIAARRKMKKHERFREKRKHHKDENGYYHKKRRT